PKIFWAACSNIACVYFPLLPITPSPFLLFSWLTGAGLCHRQQAGCERKCRPRCKHLRGGGRASLHVIDNIEENGAGTKI
ncbi:MAG: hypothetical protein P8P44_04785, partial [Alphaproteobacteria bacterium]|nr:hypothetical protein [Alphaproteobacteria bacterium]